MRRLAAPGRGDRGEGVSQNGLRDAAGPLAFAAPNGVVLHHHLRPGRPEVRPVAFANSLGTDLRIWDTVVARLDPAIPVLAFDKRGHGLSELGAEPISIETHAADLAGLMDLHGMRGALVCGVSVGGMIAQALASTRPDLVAGLALCCTGARIGEAAAWQARIDAVREGGMEAVASGVLDRWFPSAFRTAHPEALRGYRAMLTRTPSEGYAATCAAIASADLTEATARLRLPALCIAGSEDLATPPDLVRALAGLIPDASFHSLPGIGHLPCIQTPEALAALVADLHRRLG